MWLSQAERERVGGDRALAERRVQFAFFVIVMGIFVAMVVAVVMSGCRLTA